MPWRFAAFVAAALAGILMFAVGGAEHNALLQIGGCAVEIVCLYAARRWFARQKKPPAIEPGADPAWSLHDQSPPPRSPPSKPDGSG